MQLINQLLGHSSMKKYLLITFIGAVLGISIGYYILLSSHTIVVDSMGPFVLSGLVGVIIAFVNYYLTDFLDRLISWKYKTGYRLLLGIIVHFIGTVILVFSLIKLYSAIVLNLEDVFRVYKPLFIKLAILIFLSSIIFQIVYFALYSYYVYTTLLIDIIKEQRKQTELQFNALKSQLSPHFLFNGLNTISSLVYKKEQKAKLFIRQLATMYDYILKSYHTKLISLKEELTLVNSYVFLAETRFENKFFCTIDMDSSLLQTKIPPLSLQMLIENAVKHNVMSEKEPLQVSITQDGKYLSVKNNITTASKNVHSFKIGLKNINSRYLLLLGKGIIIHNEGDFIVKIPIIK